MYDYPKPDNLVELLENAITKFNDYNLFGRINAERKIDWITYGEFKQRVDNLRSGLATLGISQGDFVGIIADNRPEWAVCAFAAYGLGALFVPMYEKELVKTWEYIIKDSGIKILFVANRALFEKVKGFSKTISSLETILCIDGTDDNSMRALEERGAKVPKDPIFPKAEESAVLIYTSGTTGDPKGVLLSHGNLTSNAAGGYALFSAHLKEKTTALSILPWAHSYGQVAELYNWLQFGGRLEAALTASATMNVEVANFFFDLGIPIYDAYGMTETSPAITMNSPKAWKPGSVGRPLKDVVVTIEEEIKLLPYIENAMIYGDGKPYNICLLNMDLKTLKEFSRLLDISTRFEELRNDPATLQIIAQEIASHLENKFAHYEIPKRYYIVAEPFSLDNGLLTQTMKLRREKVLEKYQTEIAGLYEEPATRGK